MALNKQKGIIKIQNQHDSALSSRTASEKKETEKLYQIKWTTVNAVPTLHYEYLKWIDKYLTVNDKLFIFLVKYVANSAERLDKYKDLFVCCPMNTNTMLPTDIQSTKPHTSRLQSDHVLRM